MKRLLFIFLLTFSSVCAADYWFSGTAHERHKEMVEQMRIDAKEGKVYQRPHYITGDWGGERVRLAQEGITFSSVYVTDFLGNPVGGEARGFTYTGSWGYDLVFNLETLRGWDGCEFYVSFCWRRGRSLTADKIKNQFPVQQVFGTQTFQLDNLYFRYENDNRNLLWKIGRINGGDYFFQSDLYYNYVNNGFCGNPISIFFNTAFTAYPHATNGTYLKIGPSPVFSTKWAVFFANSNVNKSKYHGFDFSYNSTEKLIFITEWSFYVSPEKTGWSYPGSYRAGAYYTNGNFNANFPSNTKNGNQGFYMLFDQMVYRFDGAKKDQGIHPFMTLLFAPDGTNMMPFFTSTGVVLSGFSKKRPRDVIAFGGVYGQYSHKLNKLDNQPLGRPYQSSECDLELNYRAQISDWFYIQPDIQYIIRPSGHKNVKNALAIGAQAQLTF